jgi:hypothetical protein
MVFLRFLKKADTSSRVFTNSVFYTYDLDIFGQDTSFFFGDKTGVGIFGKLIGIL